MARKAKGGDTVVMGAPEWVVTYGDIMSLLVCFFVVMFGLSQMNKSKFRIYAAAIRGYFGAHGQQEKSLLEDQKSNDSLTVSFKEYLKRANVESKGKEQGGVSGFDGDKIKVRKIRDGLQITLGDKQLFEEGSAKLRLDDPTVRESLDYLAKELVGYRFVIKVNGFASPTEFGKIRDASIHDLWELSYARARNVMDYLAHGTKPDFQITEKRFRIGAQGTNDLVKSANGEEIPAENRSVEIIVTEQRVFFEGEDEPLQ
jgi:chemotaxis protein MotB